MILVIAYKEGNKHIVSHGVDLNNNDQMVIFPSVAPHMVEAVFDLDIGEYVIYEE